ncbi:mycolate reductase [Corynebacterium aquilae]|uniref:Short-chain dehydrogenase n=1 Tax=Corynebacterium aquilae DSM 44791 TaxID=1431546 RepID=A0A1L7CHJ3_9CORY|nr:mycolate reductase [Corynebacterium aquilae]APT85289.1 short-chain dehydrogenase [Corynebacterium aquilae DSM 44791]
MALPTPREHAYAIITGASQGIGEAMARDLASMGHNVILVARRKDILDTLAEELASTYGVTAEAFPCDLANKDERARLIEKIHHTHVSILINSAGIASFGPFLNQNWDYETTQYELNGTAVFELTHAVLPQMVERGEGVLCNVGSAAGDIPIPNNATYVFTKAGVNTFTEALHYELKGTGVHCTLLSPGPVREAVIPEEEQSIVDKVVPDFLWTTYESCSKETLNAMAANKRRVIPGPLSKVGAAIGAVLPTAVISPIIGKFYAKMGN